MLINYWVQLLQQERINTVFHKISSEHEMKWKLNAAELLIPYTPSTSAEEALELFTALTWHCASLHPDVGVRLLEIAIYTSVHRQHTKAHSHWFCPVPVGEDLYPSLMERFRPVWTQQGCAVAHTLTAELMEHPMLWFSQTGWRYWTPTLTTCRELGPARLLFLSFLPLLFSQSLSAVTLPWLYLCPAANMSSVFLSWDI